MRKSKAASADSYRQDQESALLRSQDNLFRRAARTAFATRSGSKWSSPQDSAHKRRKLSRSTSERVPWKLTYLFGERLKSRWAPEKSGPTGIPPLCGTDCVEPYSISKTSAGILGTHARRTEGPMSLGNLAVVLQRMRRDLRTAKMERILTPVEKYCTYGYKTRGIETETVLCRDAKFVLVSSSTLY